MAVKQVLVNLNFNGNQIINVRAEVAASAPASGTPGRFYFNSTQQKLYVYTTSGWQVVGQDLPANLVTGSGLTADQVVLGNGDGTVKISPYTIGASVPSNAAFTDENVAQAVATGSSDFPVLLSNSSSAHTGGVSFAASLLFVPSTATLKVSNLTVNGALKIGNDAVATQNYVDQQDQKINDRISSISGFGRYLSGWDMATGEPTSLPTTATYTLQSGDYFVISNVPSSGTKYKPNQTGTWTTSQPFAKTSTSESCVVGGYWKYDGATWSYFAPESAVSLPSFTDNSKGAIKGYQSNGYVYHDTGDAEGLGRVYGWNSKANVSGSHTITISGDATGTGSHTNAGDSNATISVTIANGAVTSVKIADGAITTAKLADRSVDHNKLKAYPTGLPILNTQNNDLPYWFATGNADEYKAIVNGVTRNGTVRLCESSGGSFNGSKEVDCLYEYLEDETGIYGCAIYINAPSLPASYAYYVLCKYEAN